MNALVVPPTIDGTVGQATSPDGHILCLIRMVPGQVRLTWGSDEWGWERAWCFHSAVEAMLALVTFDGDGDPEGRWHRAVHNGRRRRYTDIGELAEEYILR